MAERKGKVIKTKGLAYLLYFWPLDVLENGMVRFKVEPVKIETNLESAKSTFKNAIFLLAGELPEANPACEYCNLVANRKTEG